MKTIGKVILNKKLFIILTIAIMLFSNFAPIISWAVENNETTEETEDEYVKFDLTWADGETEISREYGTISAKFSLQFNTLDNFKDFRIEVERTDKVKVNYANTGEYYDYSSSASQIQYLKDIPGGTRLNGNINFVFSKAADFERYQKDLVVKLIGTYELDGEEINVELTKNLIANIIPTPVTQKHELYLNVSPGVKVDKATSSNTDELYVVSELTQTFSINYSTINSEYQKFEFDIFRTASNNDNVYHPDEVSFSDDEFTITKVDKGDGTYRYVAERGAEHEAYDPNNIKDVYKQATISAKYIIENAADDISTTGKIYITLMSKGYDVTTSESAVTGKKTTLIKTGDNSESSGLHTETDGEYTWGNSFINTANGRYITKNQLDQLLENDKMEIPYITSFQYIYGKDITGSTRHEQYKRKIEYYDYERLEYKSKYCTEDSMYVKTIEVSGMKRGEDVWIKFYKQGESEPFFTATADNLTYTAPEDEKIGDYYAELNNTLINKYSGWKTTYEINATNLKNEGLTEEDINNIKIISANIYSRGANIYTKKEEAMYCFLEKIEEAVSAFSVSLKDANLNVNDSQLVQEKEGTIYLNFGTSFTVDLGKYERWIKVENINPTFYVELPEEFNFKIEDISISTNKMRIKNYKINKYKGKKVLEIETIGQSDDSLRDHINIRYKRTLKSNYTSTIGTLKVYMKTDNENYYVKSQDVNDYNKNR